MADEPQFTPFDFAATNPQADTGFLSDNHVEPQEEPLFSPMPEPAGNVFLPLDAAAYTETLGEPFFPLPPLDDNPFLSPTHEEPISDVREDIAEESHSLSTEPLPAPDAETKDPLFAPLPDWNPFLQPEATPEPVAEDMVEEPTFSPLPAQDVNPFSCRNSRTPRRPSVNHWYWRSCLRNCNHV